MFINLERERTEQYEDESPSELAAHNADNRHCGQRHFRIYGEQYGNGGSGKDYQKVLVSDTNFVNDVRTAVRQRHYGQGG
jgi:hypothetical protein